MSQHNKIDSKISVTKLKTTLASSGLLLPELSVLLSDSNKNLTYTYIRKRVVEDNILSKPSVHSRQKIWAKLVDRYKFDENDEFFRSWQKLAVQSEGYDLAQLATLRWAQFDLLLQFLWQNIYIPLNKMESSVNSNDIIDLVSRMKGYSAPKRFFLKRSEKVQSRIAQHFLLILRECGAAKGKKNKTFTVLPIGKYASEYAVYLSKRELPGSCEILSHWALRWWGGNSTKADEILRQVESF